MPNLSPEPLDTWAVAKVSVPAFLPVKFKFKSAATEVVLSEVPVDKNNKVVADEFVCTPAEDPTAATAVEATEVFVATGIVPVEEIATPFQFVP